jgi:hypothetical protein
VKLGCYWLRGRDVHRSLALSIRRLLLFLIHPWREWTLAGGPEPSAPFQLQASMELKGGSEQTAHAAWACGSVSGTASATPVGSDLLHCHCGSNCSCSLDLQFSRSLSSSFSHPESISLSEGAELVLWGNSHTGALSSETSSRPIWILAPCKDLLLWLLQGLLDQSLGFW